MKIIFLVFLLGLLSVRSEDEVAGRKVLVLLENNDIKSSHSIFFSSLAGEQNLLIYNGNSHNLS
jgi:hypothetical protein